MLVYAVAGAVFCLAAFAQALSGFGFALVAVPLLASTVDPQAAVVTTTAVGMTMNLARAAGERQQVRWAVAVRLCAAAVAGVPFGLLMLTVLPDLALTVLIAVTTVACTVAVWRGLRLPGGSGPVVAAGVLSGVLLTATGTNGPPLVAALQALGLTPRQFRATLAAIFSLSSLVGMAGFVSAGLVTVPYAAIIAVGLPAVAAGAWLGQRAFVRVDAVRFRRIVISGLLASSMLALVHAGAGVR